MFLGVQGYQLGSAGGMDSPGYILECEMELYGIVFVLLSYVCVSMMLCW